MEVNNINKSAAINSYNSNASQHSENSTNVAASQVQKNENQFPELNKNENQKYNKKDLDHAIKKVNDFLKDEHVHTEYSYHKELKTTMVKVIDDNTKEVILELPPKKILDMVASMMKQVGLIDEKA